MTLRPPVPEDIVARVNFITAYWWQGCEAPFTLFCQFAGPPAGRAVAILLGLDAGDIVKEFFRPAGLRSHRHGRKGPRGKKNPLDIPDPNAEIGKRLPGQKEFAGRPFGSPTFYAFAIDDISERVAINLAIVDVVSDTVYQGLLGILSLDKKACPWMARVSRGNETGPLLKTLEFTAHSNPELIFQVGECASNEYGVSFYNAGRVLATYQCHFTNQWIAPCQAQIGLVEWGGRGVFARSAEVTVEPGESISLECSGTIYKPIGVGWAHKGFDSAAGPVRRSALVMNMTRPGPFG